MVAGHLREKKGYYYAVLNYTGDLSDLGDVQHFGFLCDFDVRFESHVYHSPCIVAGTLPSEWLRPLQDLYGCRRNGLTVHC